MPPLLFFRDRRTIAGGVYYWRIKNLPKCKLRIINLYNGTDSCLVTVALLPKNMSENTQNIGLVHRAEAMQSRDVSWQGEIDFDGFAQDLYVAFEDSEGVAVTNGDDCAITIGFEPQ